ncbi:MAG: hypothetical protein RDU20_12885 [Desulfomonilaceae bacterium]|nr:hypothetical protein [Desulfomonilaceae bacterium]
MRLSIFVCLIVAIACAPVTAQAQSTGTAAATPVNTSTATPSAFTIKQQILAQQQADIQRRFAEVARCIRTASLNVVLFDPAGQINTVPQTDLVNCGRQLRVLERRLQQLSRAAKQLSGDAQAQAVALETQARLALLQQNLRALASNIFASSARSTTNR